MAKEEKKDIGSLIPIVAYIIFTFAYVVSLGLGVNEVAPLSLGRIGAIFGIITLITSYFVLSFALKEMFEFDLKMKKIYAFLLVSILPILLYLVIGFFNLLDFVSVLGIGGVISGGITGVMILLMNYKSKKHSERKPEYKIPINWWIILVLCLVFILGVLIELGVFG